MKLNKTNSLTAFAAIAAVVSVLLLRESSEPDMDAGSVGNPETTAMDTNRTRYPDSQTALTEQEQALFTELQQRYSTEASQGVFNPQTLEEREQARLNDPITITHFEHASFAYDLEWAEFVDNLGLGPEDTRLVRDAWIESKARFIELGAAMGDGSLEPGTGSQAQEDMENWLYSRLSEVLSPEQVIAFHDHEEQLQAHFLASTREVTEELLNTGYSGLITAASHGDLPTVQAFLASGADPNRLTTDGESAMHIAARQNNPEILRVLIDAGADVNLKMLGGRSALMRAARSGSTDAARVLVEAGADPNYIRSNNPFSSALNSAAREGHTELVRILLDAGADATDAAGVNALEHAIRLGDSEMEFMLIEAGATAN